MATTGQHRALVSRDLAKPPKSRQTPLANGNAAYKREWTFRRVLDEDKRPVVSGNNWGDKSALRNTFMDALVALQFGRNGEFTPQYTLASVKVISNLSAHLEVVDMWNALTCLWERVNNEKAPLHARVNAIEVVPSLHEMIVVKEENALAEVAKKNGLPRLSRASVVLEDNALRKIEGALVNELVCLVEEGMDPDAHENIKELARAANLALMQIDSPLIPETFSAGAMI